MKKRIAKRVVKSAWFDKPCRYHSHQVRNALTRWAKHIRVRGRP